MKISQETFLTVTGNDLSWRAKSIVAAIREDYSRSVFEPKKRGTAPETQVQFEALYTDDQFREIVESEEFLNLVGKLSQGHQLEWAKSIRDAGLSSILSGMAEKLPDIENYLRQPELLDTVFFV